MHRKQLAEECVRKAKAWIPWKERKGNNNDGQIFQIPHHQAICGIICKSIKVSTKEMDQAISSFVYENNIYFNVADSLSSSYAHMIEEDEISQTKSFSKLQSPFPANDDLGSSLTKHQRQLSNLQL